MTSDDVTLREEGPGEFFGEIGLLSDIPRTATVTAVTDCTLHVLSRTDFLEALTQSEPASAIADEFVTGRLGQ